MGITADVEAFVTSSGIEAHIEADEKPTDRFQGNLKWFNKEKGYGFIKGDDGRDFFVHHSSIQSKSWDNLRAYQRAEYNVLRDNGRLKAVNVTVPNENMV